MSDIRKTIRKDETYKRFMKIFENNSNTDLDALLKEVEGLHATRRIRSLKGTKITSRRILEAAVEDQSYRSRLVEITLIMRREYGPLKIAFDATRDSLHSRFGSDIGGRSIADKDAFWRSMLRKVLSRLQELENNIEIVESVIGDIDQAGFTVKHTLTGLELATRPEYNV